MQPPASLKALADPIYEAFYGLSDQPFAITTDPKFFYLSTSHQVAFSELLNGLRRREGMLLLTGETGTGKTTLCRAVLESLGQRTFGAMILNPYMTGAEVFRLVLRDFGLVSHEELRRGVLAAADVSQLLDTLEGFLRSLAALDSHAVIVLDEAQSLAPQVLDQVRVLTALEQNNRRLVQVILCGQPALLETLKAEPMHALNERITRRVTLKPLEAAEVHAYIQHRLTIAGGSRAVSFDEAATRMIGELSHGLPRRINVLCDRALQEGRVESAAIITSDLVKRGARALAGVHEPVHVSVPETASPPLPPRPTTSTPAPAPPAARHVDERMAPPPTAFPDEVTDRRDLTFGQEPVRERGKGRLIAGVVLALAVIGGAAYWWYGYQLTTGTARPPLQSAPALDRGTPFEPTPPPPLDQPVAPAPPASGQLPGDPNQLN